VKPTAANTDKEAMRWSLSWHPEGRCDSFTKEAIPACAPPTSGVYGLFNFDCQVFIGESANIQDALLRHVSETDFKSRHLRATGFTFEPCAAEFRKTKAAELIVRFRPVLQTEAALTDTRSPSSGPMVSEVRLGAQELGTYADHYDFPVHERERRPKVSERFHSKRTPGAAFAAMFVTTAVAIVYLGMATDDDSQKRVNGAGEKPLARNSITPPPAPKRAEIGLRLQNQLSEPAKTSPMAHSSGISNLSKKWSVQISASRAKDIADTLMQRLKSRSYDSYMVQAEVKGQTYYRVRVGHFDAREDAESVRQSLARQEGYRDAYLTGD